MFVSREGAMRDEKRRRLLRTRCHRSGGQKRSRPLHEIASTQHRHGDLHQCWTMRRHPIFVADCSAFNRSRMAVTGI